MRTRETLVIAALVIIAGCGEARHGSIGETTQQLCVSEEPLTVDECKELENIGLVDVRCPIACDGEYVDPAGADAGCGVVWGHPADECDDTEAIRRALARAGAQRTVRLPPGSNKSTAYIVSETIELTAHSLRGEKRGAISTNVRLADGVSLVADPKCHTLPLEGLADPWLTCKSGAVFAIKGANVELESFVLDAAATSETSATGADYGVYAYQAPGADLGIMVMATRKAACIIEESERSRGGCKTGKVIPGEVAKISNYRDGEWFVGSDNAQATTATLNGRHGLVVTTRPGSGSGGGLQVTGRFEKNQGHGVYVSNTHTPLAIKDVWFEGNAAIQLRIESSEHVVVAQNRFVGNTSVTISSCKHCIVRENVVAGGDPDTHDIFMEGTNKYAYVANNIYRSSGKLGPTDALGGNGSLPFELVWTTPSGVMTFSQDEVRFLAIGTPSETDPMWQRGDVVWNRAANGAGDPAGWVCARAGGYRCRFSNGTSAWTPFGPLL